MTYESKLISRKDVANMLQCSVKTVMNRARLGAGFPRPVKLGTSMQAPCKFKRAEIEAWIDEQQGGHADEVNN